MWSAILEFFARLGTFFVKRADNPSIQYRKETDKNAKAISEGDTTTVNAQLELGLNGMSDSRSDNPRQ